MADGSDDSILPAFLSKQSVQVNFGQFAERVNRCIDIRFASLFPTIVAVWGWERHQVVFSTCDIFSFFSLFVGDRKRLAVMAILPIELF